MVESLAGAYNSNRHGIFKGINSPRIFGVLDQLHGSGTWKKPPGWGGFIITFPEGSGQPWDIIADGWHWHWDGDERGHDDGLTGVHVFLFFSTVEPGGGGTLIVEGSHRLLVDFFRQLGPEALTRKRKGINNQFARSYPWLM